MKKISFVLIFALAFSFAYDMNITKGQAVILEFGKKGLKEIQSKSNLDKKEKKERFMLHPSDDNKVVLIFSSSYRKPIKEAKISALYANGEIKNYHLLGYDGSYKVEKLTVAANKVKPPKEVLARIQKELKEANKIYATFTDEALYDGKFIKPLDSAITSHFGTARVFNNTLASYHSGTDFRAKVGTPILAANSGVVRLAKDRYYAGGSVIIDHGYKIFSQYYHLSEIKVKVGQKVNKGDVIALSGDSGRVTGAHLHFGIFAGGNQVDPMDFIKKFNDLVDEKVKWWLRGRDLNPRPLGYEPSELTTAPPRVKSGWGKGIRTPEWQDQNLLPYRLAIPQ